MISSAKTLFLATLVFNAATVFGAPIRNVDTSSESVARAEMSTPVQPVARAAIVDVQDNRRRSRLGHITRRSARLVSERDDNQNDVAPVVNEVGPMPVVREHRYPRQALYDRHENHEKRKPAVTVLGMTAAPAPVAEPRERRYPRRVLHDRHEKREPATNIKETTTVIEKITVLDTPEDALAFNSNNPGNGASGSTSVSTLVSISATTTLALDGSVPTATPTDAVPPIDAVPPTDSVSASPTDISASPTATLDPSATTDPAALPTDPAATPTATDGATDPAVTASPTADPAAPASSTSPADDPEATPPAGGDGITVVSRSPAGASADPDARRGIYIRGSTEPILRRLAFSGASYASSVRRQLNSH